MKLKCEYCECYIDTDGITSCPRCNAPLGAQIEAELIRQKAERDAREQAEAEAAAKAQEELLKAQRQQAVINLATTAVGSILGSGIGSSLLGTLVGRSFKAATRTATTAAKTALRTKGISGLPGISGKRGPGGFGRHR